MSRKNTEYKKLMNLKNLKEKKLPLPFSFSKMLGPSFILLGLGLGSGELILWPYLTANFGMGIIWAAFMGILFQFFLNMEISRYTLATGESVFVGLARRYGILAPLWFIISTFIPWMWPGIMASSSMIASKVLGFPNHNIVGIISLLFIGLVLSLGKWVYLIQEKFQKILIALGVPFFLFLFLKFIELKDIIAFAKGMVGIGEGYLFFPKLLPFSVFLGALAYAGAGGNLNLSQSLYVREKGYGMAKYSQKIKGLFFLKNLSNFRLEGYFFKPHKENISIFNKWWRLLNLEHFLVFLLTGFLTIVCLSMLSFSTLFGKGYLFEGIQFIFEESNAINNLSSSLLAKLFLLVSALMLFGTQFSILGSTGRILTENFLLLFPRRANKASLFFYLFLWLEILAGVLIFSFGFLEPLTLVIIGAVLNAFTMFIYSIFVLILNNSFLPKEIRPSFLRNLIVSLAAFVYGILLFAVIYDNLKKIQF